MKLLLKLLIKNHWKKIILILILTFIYVNAQLYMLDLTTAILREIKASSFDYLDGLTLDILISIAVSVISFLFISYLSISVTSNFAYETRRKMFDIYLNASTIDEFNEFKFSGLMARTIRGITTMQSFFLLVFRKVILIIMITIGVIIDCFYIDNDLGVIFTVVMLSLSLIFVFRLHSLANSYFDIKKINGTLNGAFRDKVNGLKFVKLFSREKYFNRIFEKVAETSYNRGYRFQYKLNFYVLILIAMYITVFFVVLLCSVIFEFGILYDDILILLFDVTYLLTSLRGISNLVNVYPLAYTSSIRIEEVLVLENEDISADTDEIEDWDEIEFKDVSLNISDREILSDISFKIPKGSKTLILGPVGSGKTMLSYLLIGFHKSTSGKILLDGKNVNLNDSLNINLTSDDFYLLNGTVFDNINMGDDSISHQIALNACREVLFNHDLDYKVNENGNNLSVVEKQKLNIARALAHDGDIYIFDNSFSLFDLKTKRLIRENIKAELTDKTVIIIENDYESDLVFDNVIVLDNGHIVESNNEDPLIGLEINSYQIGGAK